jgi:hypothetical protein
VNDCCDCGVMAISCSRLIDVEGGTDHECSHTCGRLRLESVLKKLVTTRMRWKGGREKCSMAGGRWEGSYAPPDDRCFEGAGEEFYCMKPSGSPKPVSEVDSGRRQ